MTFGIIAITSAILIGIGVGFALQKGRGCTNTAFRNLLLIGNNELALMIIVVVSVEIIGYFFLSLNLLPGLNFVDNPIPFSYVLIPLGGFIFGIGTVFAGGCAGGICYRVGQGSIASVLGFLGFAFGIGIIGVGLASRVNDLRNSTLITLDNQSPSLSQFLPRWFWTIMAVIILILTILYYRSLEKSNKIKLTHLLPRWTPINTGIVIGIFGVLARYFSSISNREFGLSTTDGIAEIFLALFGSTQLGWAGIFILAMITGSAIAAIQGKEFRLSVPDRYEFIRFFGGGTLLGIGAMLGLGCNFGHIFGGMPELGISSFLSVIFMILGNWTASQFYYNTLGAELPISTPQF